MNRKTLLRGVLIALGVYLAFAVLARLFAARALYYPEIASRRPADGVQKIRGADGNDVAILHLPNPAARFTIWFFHGNAEDLGDLEPWLRLLRDAGYSVFAFDYPGYGLSGGQPSESSLYAASRTARSYLREQLSVPASQTLIYGRSVGGGPAMQMATEERVGGLILQSTFTSVFRVLTGVRLLPFDFFENERKLARISAPVLVMHGEQDEIIPFSHGEQLFAAAKEPKRFYRVPGAAHNDFLLVAGKQYWDVLREFSAFCAASDERKI
jgi:abhydrolase domain-containing protein 17